MLKKLPYNKLKLLGVTLWRPRVQVASIVPEHVRIYARCLVLSDQSERHAVINPAQQKIFDGMLSVLDLSATQIMYATISDAKLAANDMVNYVQEWQPEFILQLSMDLPDVNKQNWVRTFSPAYLLENPQYKMQAYKTLLNLRSMLHDTATEKPNS